jgi:hypothetical protein
MAEEPVVETVLLAQNVILNAGTGNVSFIEVFNDLRLISFPSLVAFHIVTVIRNAFRPFAFETLILAADGSSRWQGQLPIPVQKDPILYIDMATSPISLRGPEQLGVVVRIDGQDRYTSILPVRYPQPTATPSIRP